jgi:hypothetical protein
MLISRSGQELPRSLQDDFSRRVMDALPCSTRCLPALFLLSIVGSSLAPPPVGAQVSPTVGDGDLVRVEWIGAPANPYPTLWRAVGRAVSVSPDSIVVLRRSANGPRVHVAASQITLLEVGQPDHLRSAGRGAAAGALVLGAAGTLFALVWTVDDLSERRDAVLLLGGGSALVGAASGGLVGLVLSDTRWRAARMPPRR